MSHRSETFGKLVRGALNAITAFENKKANIVEEELGSEIGVSGFVIQRYKQGQVPQDPRAIEILARAGVRRGCLDREWLNRFLQVARYVDAERLIEELRPTAPASPHPPRARDNLPAPTYSQFVMRTQAYAQVLEGLSQRSAVVLIISMGGMGKTSLALEVAKRSLRWGGRESSGDPFTPMFDTAVWISDKDQPGVTRLGMVLDEIARTLDYPGCTRLELREKQYEVEQLLRQQRVLLIIDNFETITDGTLLQWLLRLPEPSKALVTTRVYRREFQRGAWLVELDGMGEAEVQQLIDLRARQLKLAGTDRDEPRRLLLTATGGNPKAIDLILGHVKYTSQSIEAVVGSLRDRRNELLTDLFEHSWTILTTEARQILMTMAVFPSSASRSGLMAAADVAEPTFTHAVQQLLDLSLIEAEQPTDDITAMGHKARLATHPLTRTFVSTLLAARPEAAQAAYERWLEWCCACAAASGGYVLSDMGRLAALDMDEPTLFAAVEWAFDHGRDHEVIALVKNLEFYYYVRALWGKKLALHRWYIVAANRLDDANEEIYALALHIQLLSRQGNWGEAAQYLSRLDELIQEQPLRGALAFNYHHTHGLYLLARSEPGQTDLQAAQGHWQWLLDHSEDLDAHMTTGTQHWLGTCLTLQGQVGLARSAFCEALDLANGNGFTRLAARNQLGLALLDIDDGNLEHAEERLAECQALTQLDDWEQRARFDWAHARLSARRGAISAAQAHYDDAITLFVRMGLERERAEAERERNALDTFT